MHSVDGASVTHDREKQVQMREGLYTFYLPYHFSVTSFMW